MRILIRKEFQDDMAKEWSKAVEAEYKAQIEEAVLAEREACARVCDGLADVHEKMNQWGSHKTAETLAQAIRARGQA